MRIELIEENAYCCDKCGKALTHKEIEYNGDNCDACEPDFASQQEVTLWVAQGNKTQFITGDVVGFKGGVLWNFSKNQKSDYCFCAPSQWKKTHAL